MLIEELINSITEGKFAETLNYLHQGANPNTLSKDGATAMHIATGVSIDALKLLLGNGGDPNVRAVDGSTPLHIAAAWGNSESVKLLLQNGANPDLLDHDGQRAVNVAKSEGHEACADILKYYSMLVAVGNEEECPKYTAQPLDSEHINFISPDPCLQLHEISSDEEDFCNLSAKYSDVVSRKLSRLLSEGEKTCFDVTSPDCPYFYAKQKVYQRDKTARLTSPSQGRNCSSENDYSCLKHHSPMSHADSCCWEHTRYTSPSLCMQGQIDHSPFSCSHHSTLGGVKLDTEKLQYAKQLERRMKQKYFPDLVVPSDASCSSESCHCRASADYNEKSRTAMHSPPQIKTADLCTTGLECMHMPSKLLNIHLQGNRVKSPSPGKNMQKVHPSNRTGNKIPLQGNSGHCFSSMQNFPSELKSKRACSCVYHNSPDGNKSLLSQAHHHRDEFISPQHNTQQNLTCCQRSFEKCPRCAGKCCSVYKSPTKTETCSGTNNPGNRSATCCHYSSPKKNVISSEANASCNKIYLDKSSSPPMRNHIVMPVLSSTYTLPSSLIQRFSGEGSYANMNTNKHELEHTNLGGKDAPVIASRSSQSVDSGYCGNSTTGSPKKIGAYCDCLHHPETRSGPFQIATLDSNRAFVKTGTAINISPSSNVTEVSVTETVNGEVPEYYKNSVANKIIGFKEMLNTHSKHYPGRHIISNEVSTCKNVNDRRDFISKANAIADEKLSGNLASNCKDGNASLSSTDSFHTCKDEATTDVDSEDVVGCFMSSGMMKINGSPCSTLPAEYSPQLEEREKPLMKRSANAQSFYRNKDRFHARESFGFSVPELKAESNSPRNADDCISKQLKRPSSPSLLTTEANKNALQKESLEFSLSSSSEDNENFSLERQDWKVKDMEQTASASPQFSHKIWLPPMKPLPDDSDLFTSDDSFLTRPEIHTKEILSKSSHNVSKWLENLSIAQEAQTHLSADKFASTKPEGKTCNRLSDASYISSSSVREFIYQDTETGVALIERHIPSECSSSSSSRLSLESTMTFDSDATIHYDWTKSFAKKNSEASVSLLHSDFDITAGHTLASDTSLKIVDSTDGESIENAKSLNSSNGSTASNGDNNKAKCNTQDISETAELKDLKIPDDLMKMSNEAIYQSLKELGEDPGPVMPSTRQTYLIRLASLQSGKAHLTLTTLQPGYSEELNRILTGSLDLEELAQLEMEMVAPFQTPGSRIWREGTIKCCFNYLLLDPRITNNLPLRAKSMSDQAAFKVFLCAIFYIGKGKRSRPYCHLYEAISQLKAPKQKISRKVQTILDIWSSGLGVVSLHCFQNVIAVEAYTREACMVEAIGLKRLTNVKRGDYYGVASTWSAMRKRSMGAYLLRKSFQIFLSEGERQISPLDIHQGK